MFRKTVVGVFLALILAGCQNQQYVVMCDTQTSRNLCEVGDLETPECRRANAAVDGCASYVSYKIRQLETAKRKETGMVMRTYRAQSTQPLMLGLIGTSTQYPVYVKSDSLNAYVGSARMANKLVELRLNIYKAAVNSYLRDLNSNYVADDKNVTKAISDIKILRGPFEIAVQMGQPIVDFYASLPSQDFEALANQVVAQTNPKDPYLRLGAVRAIHEQKRFEKNSGLKQAQAAVADFKTLQAVLDAPYATQFATLKTQAVAEAVKARRVNERQRVRARSVDGGASSGGQRFSDSSCSCAGHNVCYGPRGGRYCITSGGNKRYGI
jgi:hypothetical protein